MLSILSLVFVAGCAPTVNAALDESNVELGGCPFTPGAEPQKKALFAHPLAGGDLTIENELRRLVQAAVPGSRLRISMYSWSRTGVTDDVIAAARRGVDVRVVVDGHNRVESATSPGTWVPNAAVGALRDALGQDRVVICSEDDTPEHLTGGCLSTGINHNKYAVFSELCDGSRSVVFQSSENFSSSQLVLYQNAVVMRDDPGLFAGYESYWTDEAAQRQIPDYFRQVDGRGTRAFFFPHRPPGVFGKDPDTDPIYNLLDNVSCAGGTRVRLEMAYFHDNRDYLVGAFRRLRDEGCDVKLAVSQALTDDGVAAELRAAFSSDEVRFISHIHSKFLFVDGTYAGARRKLVWTGSHNYLYSALRTNDETLLRVDDPAVFAAFDADWQAMWDEHAP